MFVAFNRPIQTDGDGHIHVNSPGLRGRLQKSKSLGFTSCVLYFLTCAISRKNNFMGSSVPLARPGCLGLQIFFLFFFLMYLLVWIFTTKSNCNKTPRRESLKLEIGNGGNHISTNARISDKCTSTLWKLHKNKNIVKSPLNTIRSGETWYGRLGNRKQTSSFFLGLMITSQSK